MPAYNAAEHVREAIMSVQAQTWPNWELVVVNDGSQDATAAILDGLDDARIIVVHQENKGVSAARNTGLDRARGEIIAFLDADDVLPSAQSGSTCGLDRLRPGGVLRGWDRAPIGRHRRQVDPHVLPVLQGHGIRPLGGSI
ncbi:MAG: glycosyltransferase family 2 protein [Flavobacteriales bacterium]|nr:glycosyltransferase family 2 protein [Flavobacteriales bacterium]